MIYIVHGDDFSKSRNLVLNQQKKLEIESRIELEISDTTPEDFFSHVHSTDLFGNPSYIVLNISKAGRTNLEPYIQKTANAPENTFLVILSDKTLTSTNAFIKAAGKLGAKIILSEKAPVSSTFKFVDAVFYKQRDNAYKELAKLRDDDIDPFEIFSMLLWGLRNVAQAKLGNDSYFKGRDFVRNKALSQARLFSDSAMTGLFEAFADADVQAKTGSIDQESLIPFVVEKVLNS